ncbi:uncharacterized protein RSE6_02551 [Rhynchosporium secalis]|uniref:Ankyrin n=1 Tax=Rhynchosporium secalis TaxID=38038 RepID=A0A1E1M0I9_RHYSE|nr:uncharacterized protein RSE6_02551 [Rhynchosporium secalis]
MIHILITDGADVDNTIGSAVAAVDERLLQMLLEVNPPVPVLSDTLPAAVATRDPLARQRLTEMLLRKGADVNIGNGQPILEATKLCDMFLINMLLKRRLRAMSLNQAFNIAPSFPDSNSRFEVCQKLIDAGATGTEVNKGLAVAMTDECQNMEFLKLYSVVRRISKMGMPYAKLEQSFDNAFGGAMSLRNPGEQLKYCRILVAAGPPPNSCSKALVVTVTGQKHDLCKTLLSVHNERGASVTAAARSGNFGILELLIGGDITDEDENEMIRLILAAGLEVHPLDLALVNTTKSAVINATLEAQEAMVMCKLLLKYGASVNAFNGEALDICCRVVHYEEHRPLVTAARNVNIILLRLLLGESKDLSAPSKVFSALMQDEQSCRKQHAFDVLTLLIEHGARGIAVDDALIRALKDTQLTARHFEVTLMQHANVDHKDGEALQIATERGEAALVRRMLALRPKSLSISMAFPYAFVSGHPDIKCPEVIQAFTDVAADDLYPEFMHPEISEPPVFLCMKYYPHSKGVLGATLDAGFDIDQPMSSESRSFTAWYWASSGGKNFAKVNNHPEPLLTIAVEHLRQSIVEALLKAGADVDEVDESDLTPLSLAAQKQDVANMQTLLAAKALSNNGSLHEATRTVNAEAIKLLLDFGHDPNFPCLRIEGRPPLFELSYRAPTCLLKTQLTSPQTVTAVKKTVDCLIKGGALTKDHLPQAGNHSLLMHALDSANPNMMRDQVAARRKLALEQEAEQARLDRENRAFQLRQAHDAKLHQATIAKENDRTRIQEARSAHALQQATSTSQLRSEEEEARHMRSIKLVGERKMLAQSQEALHFAYNMGRDDAAGLQGRKALGSSSSKNILDLGRAARLRIEGGFPNRIEELDE